VKTKLIENFNKTVKHLARGPTKDREAQINDLNKESAIITDTTDLKLDYQEEVEQDL
jgi:hypothetical protein